MHACACNHPGSRPQTGKLTEAHKPPTRLDVSLDEVERAIRQFGTNSGGGFVDQNRTEYVIRNIGRTTRVEDLRSLVVTVKQGQPVQVKFVVPAK